MIWAIFFKEWRLNRLRQKAKYFFITQGAEMGVMHSIITISPTLSDLTTGQAGKSRSQLSSQIL